jgi:sulfotransferase family protein
MSEQQPKVVYVMGAGRSGSTILGVTLGNCTDVLFAGELHLWLAKQGRSPLPGSERERFWGTVRDAVKDTPRVPARAARALEQSVAVLDPRGWRARRRLRGRYRHLTEEVFRATAEAAGATHVVDTSHFPRRAKELQALDGIELYLLFVVRSPASVIASYSRDDVEFPRFNALTTNAYLWLTYLLSLSVFLRHPRDRRLLVRYEAFVSSPQRVLQEILDCIGSTAEIPDLQALDTGVAFQGNRVLYSDVVALKSRPDRPSLSARLAALPSTPWSAVFSLLRPAASSRAPAPAAFAPAASDGAGEGRR